jgi:hypothetical protein
MAAQVLVANMRGRHLVSAQEGREGAALAQVTTLFCFLLFIEL